MASSHAPSAAPLENSTAEAIEPGRSGGVIAQA
jgi:hypothetical protein|eukprot:SAG25_NODE_672_length_6012_cov_14.256046_4_plen_33_part_00